MREHCWRVREAWRRDPVLFVRQVYGVVPEEYQAEFLRSLVPERARVAIRSCHGAGKTTENVWAQHWFSYAWGPCKVIVTAPTWRQVEKIHFAEGRYWAKRAERNGMPLGGSFMKFEHRLADDWFAVGLSTNEPAAFEGWHAENVMFILDEAKGLPQWVFDSAEGLLNVGVHLKLIASSTPSVARGPFYDCFADKRDRWKNLHVTWQMVKRNGGLGKWAAARRKDWGEFSPVYRAKVLGEFVQVDADCLIQLDWIDVARQGPEDCPDGDVMLSVDVARHGDDDSAFCVRKGGRILELEGKHGADTMAVADWSAVRINRHGIEDTRVDTVGVGAGVFDALKRRGFKVREFKGSHRPLKRERFNNARSESYWAMREAFREGLVDLSGLPERSYNRLVKELVGIRFYADEQGRVCIEPKEQYKKRQAKLLGPENAKSPDFADALAMAYAPRLQLVFDYTQNFEAVKRQHGVAV